MHSSVLKNRMGHVGSRGTLRHRLIRCLALEMVTFTFIWVTAYLGGDRAHKLMVVIVPRLHPHVHTDLIINVIHTPRLWCTLVCGMSCAVAGDSRALTACACVWACMRACARVRVRVCVCMCSCGVRVRMRARNKVWWG